MEFAGEEQNQPAVPTNRRSRGCVVGLIFLFLVSIAAWLILRPGVFTVQPIGALPDGVTVIYHSRNPDMPFFSSPDGLCLKTQGSVSLLCRSMALSAVSELTDRMLIKLRYSRWAYLRSTDGREFDK
jgi:hypothetical protein